MTEERVIERLENYKRALARLREALIKEDPNQFVYDATIKRFEFTYELAWKLLKALIEYKGGEDLRFPRDVFREAYAKGLLKNGEVWLDMIKDRNLSSYTYSFEKALDIYERIKECYFDEFEVMMQTVEGEVGR
jgi:nucleotidyltransferase substrate binding protein (TIGR01987 family)